MRFYDREAEINALRKYERMSAQNAQMIVITGRRRIGKTTLIKRAFNEIPFLYFFVGKKSEALLCEELAGIVSDVLGEDLGDFTSFRRLLSAIMGISKRLNFTLVLDEFQNLKYVNNALFSDFQDVWDSNKQDSRINLVICGSIYSKMKKIFDDKEEPLYGRATARFKIKPFSIGTVKEILRDYNPDYTPDDLLCFYMITGGVAKYVELLMDQNAVNKDKMISATVSLGSYFVDEGRELFSDEFGKDYGNYFSILAAIAQGHTSRGDIKSYVGFETGGYLDRLEEDYNIVAKRKPYQAGDNTRNVRYGISDNFLIFWFRFIYKYRSAVEIGNMDFVREKILADYESFSGFCLERYFRQKYMETGLYNVVTNYWESGRNGSVGENNEIDLVAVNENEKRIVIAECKRNHDKINVSALKDKAKSIASHHKNWTFEYSALSLLDM